MDEKIKGATVDTTAAIAAGMLLGEVRIVDEEQLAIVMLPAGATVKEIDLSKFKSNPPRAKGSRSLATADSFIEFVKRLGDEHTTVYSDKDDAKFTAVFNDHTFEMPGWGDFTATYTCPKSPEWVRWFGNSQHGEQKRSMTQAQFAQFIEDNLPDIIRPASADMLLVSRTLEAKKDVKFASGIRLSDGAQQFSYEEQIEGTANKGQMKVPDMFTISIPVFEGGTVYEVDARLRYRIDQGKLAMWYELVRPHKIIEHAFKQTLDQIKAGLAEAKFFDV